MRAPPLRRAADLVAAGLVPASRQAELDRIGERYAIGLTETMAGLIDPADPQDPIARQFIPDPAELVSLPEEMADPIGDETFSPVPGVVHRYPDRVLLKLLHVCPVYCRFCFRRETVGPGGPTHLEPAALGAALDYIRGRPEIWEVILTGGDPLTLSPRRLGEVMQRLAEIGHVKVVRLHSRVPIVDPERIGGELTSVLRASGQAVYVAVHANHPRELTAAARRACADLVDAGIPLLSQTVLLRGVNDDITTLTALMRGFVEARIKPYYLHQLDLARGTSHFRVPIEEGQALLRALRGRVSGLCQPRYVVDIPGGYGKAPVDPGYTVELPDGQVREIVDYAGRPHVYPPEAPGEKRR